jgi:hypothetical protein
MAAGTVMFLGDRMLIARQARLFAGGEPRPPHGIQAVQ